MEPYIVLAQQNVLFHGIWRAQHKVSDTLIKSIASSIPSTPSRACKLLLTSSGLTLIVLPSADGKTGKTDQVSFDSLRDILPNQYNPKCLLIIYVDNAEKFVIMACSSESEKNTKIVSKAFRDRKNLIQHQRTRSDPQPSLNSGSIEKQRFFSDGQHSSVKDNYLITNSSTINSSGTITNGVTLPRESYDSSQRSDSVNSSCTEYAGPEDVFVESPTEVAHNPDVVFRRLAKSGTRPVLVNIGIQTLLSEEDSDSDFINTLTCFQVDRDDVFVYTEEMNTLMGGVNKYTGSTLKEYNRRRDMQEIRNVSLPKTKSHPRFQDKNIPELNNGHVDSCVPTINADNDNNEEYEARSIGIQTLPSDRTIRRYAKKQVSASTSNAYKEKLATRKKRSASANARSPTSNDPGPGPVASAPKTPTTNGMSGSPSLNPGSTLQASSTPSIVRSVGRPDFPSSTSGSILRSQTTPTISRSSARSNVPPTTSGSNLRSHNSPTISGSTSLPHTPPSVTGPTSQSHIFHTINQQRIVTGSPLSLPRPVPMNIPYKHCSTVVKPIEDVYNGMPTRLSLRGRGQRVVMLTSAELIRK